MYSTNNEGKSVVAERFRFLLCVIDIFSKYASVVALKDKKGVSIVNAFQKILEEFNRRQSQTKERKPNKIWVDICIQHIMKKNLLLPKDLLEH